MKLCVLAILLIIVVTPPSICYALTIVASIIWLIYTMFYIFKLKKIKDKKEVIKDYCEYPPNNNYASYLRFLYSGKVDYKVFVATIFELIEKGSIKLVRKNKNEYYFIDDKDNNIELTKSEEELKKLLFRKIGDGEVVSLDKINKSSKRNNGYFYEAYKEWQTVFNFEAAKYKYFKPIKPIIDSSLLYFVMSLVIVVYNILFTKFIVISLIIFYVTSYLTIEVNDYCNREDEAKEEYIKWLKFKNYINKNDNNLNELDMKTLENYALYAYVLDEYESFFKVLYKKYNSDDKIFNDSVILSIINVRIFDEIESKLKKSIKIAKWKTVLLSSKNRGKRI